MIQISILKTAPSDDIQKFAAIKLKEMILVNVGALIDQLDDGQNIQSLVQVIITDRQFVAEQSGMVFVLSDILDQEKTQKLFDQINIKTKILIDLDPENKNASNWKCGTYASSSVKSCFESRKNMTTKEMLIKVLYNHNKKNNHHETRALLLSALALGLECYDEKSNSSFCSKLMNEDAGQVMAKAYDYDMNKRGISSYITPILTKLGGFGAWAAGLASSTYLVVQSAVLGTVGSVALMPAILMMVGAGITIYAVWKLIMWLKGQAVVGLKFEESVGDQSNALIKLWNYLRSDKQLNIVVNQKGEVDEQSKENVDQTASNIDSVWEKAKEHFGIMGKGLLWLVLSLICKIPAWIEQFRRHAMSKGNGLQGVLRKAWWIKIFRTVDICISKNNYYCMVRTPEAQQEIEKYPWQYASPESGVLTILLFGLVTAILFVLLAAQILIHVPIDKISSEIITTTFRIVSMGNLHKIKATSIAGTSGLVLTNVVVKNMETKLLMEPDTTMTTKTIQKSVDKFQRKFTKKATIKLHAEANDKVLIIVDNDDFVQGTFNRLGNNIIISQSVKSAVESGLVACALVLYGSKLESFWNHDNSDYSIIDSNMPIVRSDGDGSILYLIEMNKLKKILYDTGGDILGIDYDSEKYEAIHNIESFGVQLNIGFGSPRYSFAKYDKALFSNDGFSKIVFYGGLDTIKVHRRVIALANLYNGPIDVVIGKTNGRLVNYMQRYYAPTWENEQKKHFVVDQNKQ